MFSNIGTTQIIIIALVLLVLFGSKLLPKTRKNRDESEKEPNKPSKELKEAAKDE